METISDWPGKSDGAGNEHPAVLHMLEVAACAEQLIGNHTAFAAFSQSQRQAFVVLIALHDVGKLSESFRALLREKKTGATRHWELSDFMLCRYLDDILAPLGADNEVRTELYAAVAGHHGKPPNRCSGSRFEIRKRQCHVGKGEHVARKWVGELIDLFPGASLEGITKGDARAISWALAGLTTAADWVGSNTIWFPFKSNYSNIQEALEQSRCAARRAVQEAGLQPPRPAEAFIQAFSRMFTSKLRPMQMIVQAVPLGEGPQLFVMEDTTGTGKTEAGLFLAHRMIEAGKARGLFFALPTMATSNAMFERMRMAASAMYQGSPSVILTHSRAKISQKMRELSCDYSDCTPESECVEWLSDNRRRGLLATVAVGTIDQALLGILPTKFSTLRLFGLADKVIIVDEAHSYDPYMQEQLKTLLRMHARLGGSAILMTATLPLKMRQEFAEAFCSGLNSNLMPNLNDDYPGIYAIGYDAFSSKRVNSWPESARTIKVERVCGIAEAKHLLIKAAESGAACVWIRNAVDDAIEAAEELKDAGANVDLLHARFALVDRLRKEKALMSRFGKIGRDRSGRILVATQLVEASLDLDFDVMISDLAPIGSLIQRAGRLWRHMDVRPLATRPIKDPVLHVVSPNPEEVLGEKWLHEVLPRGAWVYRLDHQWLTAKAIFDAGEIVTPTSLRHLIEAVHGDHVPHVPEELTKAQAKADGEAIAHMGLAKVNVVNDADGYLYGCHGAIGNDGEFPTRIGERQVAIALARRDQGGVIPWADITDIKTAWSFSEISASWKKFRDILPNQDNDEIKKVKESWPEWRRAAFDVCVVSANGEITKQLQYSTVYGLRVQCLE